MFLILLLMQLLHLLLLSGVQCYVLFAANLDDFHTIAKKFVPDQLADQLTNIASKTDRKDTLRDIIKDTNESKDTSSTDEELKVNFEDLVKRVKERIEKDLVGTTTREVKRKTVTKEDSRNKSRYRESLTSLRPQEKDSEFIKPKYPDNEQKEYQMPLVEKTDRMTFKEKIEEQTSHKQSSANDHIRKPRLKNRNYLKKRLTSRKPNDRHYLDNDYGARDDIYKQKQPITIKTNENRDRYDEDPNIYKQNDRIGPKKKTLPKESEYEEIQYYKPPNRDRKPKYKRIPDRLSHSQDTEKQDVLNKAKPNQPSTTENYLKKRLTTNRDEDNRDYEYYELKGSAYNKRKELEKTTEDASKHRYINKQNIQKYKKISNQPNYSDQNQDYEESRNEMASNAKSQNINWQTTDSLENNRERISFSKNKQDEYQKDTYKKENEQYDEISQNQYETITFPNKNDSYEDYVTPKKDSDYSEEKTDYNYKNKAQIDNNRVSRTPTRFVANKHPGVSEADNAKVSERPPIDGVVHRMHATMIPTREFYKMSTPNYLAKIPIVAETYNFNEPLPENDRFPEDLRPIGNPPASINKKVRLE